MARILNCNVVHIPLECFLESIQDISVGLLLKGKAATNLELFGARVRYMCLRRTTIVHGTGKTRLSSARVLLVLAAALPLARQGPVKVCLAPKFGSSLL